MPRSFPSALLLLSLLLPGCAVRSPQQEASDPLEPFNRFVYMFNDVLDRTVMKPVARRYQKYVPPPARTGVRNFFNNLYEPITVVNNTLQGKPGEAAGDLMRFGFNSVFGVFGLVDVSTDWGLPHHVEDFGQTFAVWGFGEGWYLMLPLLGPSNVRDGIGLLPEYKLSLLSNNTSGTTRYAAYALKFVSKRADLLSATNVLETSSLDEYVQVREAYRQQRWNQIHDGNPPEPDFFDEELFEDDSSS
ncbi:MAG TPA: VacJ family lipoprotein [Gammaproteobacteria bacterium]|nr:VacJ family lipoprotein [Gammaproteobacteria bacterium]